MALDSAYSVLRRVLTKWTILGQLLMLLVCDLAVHWTLLTEFDGYLSWGNFLVPFTASQFPAGPAIFWIPFQFGGTPGRLGFATITGYIEASGPQSLLANIFGLDVGLKIYILLSTLWVGFAALLFARTLIRHPVGQVTTAVFVMAGPFGVALYGQGDYQQFIPEGLIFLSLFALWLGINRPSQRWMWLPLAAWSIILTFQTEQAFLLGLLLMACMFPVYIRDWVRLLPPASKPVNVPERTTESTSPGEQKRKGGVHGWLTRAGQNRGSFLAEVGVMLVRVPALVAVAGVIIVPSYVTLYLLGSGASGLPSALPLSTFASYSTGPISLLTLTSYFNLTASMVGAGAGGVVVLSVWKLVVLLLLILIWASYFIVRDFRLVYLLFLSVAAAMIGAGPAGPAASLSTFLYLRFPGYAAINASYYWDWFLIVPVYALMLGLVVEWSTNRVRAARDSRPRVTVGSTSRISDSRLGRCPDFRRAVCQKISAKGVAICAVALLCAVAIIPIANGGYYAPPNGISEVNYPSDYKQIPGLLENLIGSTYAGVALFNPDVSWYLFNSTHSIPNAFFLFPNVRTPGIPIYLAPPDQSNAFFYWLYDEFYSNTTRYAGELFATVGVEYFLVFYGTQSASYYPYFLQFSYGKNASNLLKFQTSVVPVVQEQYFAIYRNLAFNGVALADSNLSLVAGPGYDELNSLAYAGIGLANQSWLFPSDLPANDCSAILSRMERVYTATPNALIGVALQCDHIAIADPVSDTSPSASDLEAWIPSTNTLGVPIIDSWPGPLAATDGGPNTISVPLSFGECTGNCRMWLPVRVSGDGGALNFDWDGATWSMRTNSGLSGLNNTMVWIQLPFDVTTSGDLSITAMGGWNAIGPVYVFGADQSSQLTSPMDWLNSSLVRSTIIEASPASLANIRPNTASGEGLSYLRFTPANTVNSIPGDQGIIASNFGAGSALFSLPMVKPAGPGWIALLVRATAYAYINVSEGSGAQPQLIGFDTGDYNSSHNYWQTILVPWNESQSDPNSNLTLSLVKGILWLAEVWFVPESIPGSNSPMPVVPPSSGTPSLYWTSNVSISNWSTGVSRSGFLSVTANGFFGPATSFDQFLFNFRFGNPAPPGTALAISVNITPGLLIVVNGVVISYRSEGSFTLFGPLFQNPVVFPSSNLTFNIQSYGDFPARNNTFEFAARFAFIELPLVWNVTDFRSSAPLEVSADTSGYQVRTNESALVLVRVADYPGLMTDGGASLGPALGTLDTLIWSPAHQSEVDVYPSSTGFLYLGFAVSILSTAAWIGGELWIRNRSVRARLRETQS